MNQLIKTLELFIESAHTYNHKTQNFCSLRFIENPLSLLPCMTRRTDELHVQCCTCIFENKPHRIKLTEPMVSN